MQVSGGARYAVALAVDALGSGMLRPFLLLYGIKVLGLGVTETGAAMSVGLLLGLAAVPFFGRWIDRGARTAAVACAMLVRVLGIALLLAPRRAQVPLADHEPEREVVDRRIAEPDQDQEQRSGRDVEVQRVVEQAGREPEPVIDPQRVDQCK